MKQKLQQGEAIDTPDDAMSSFPERKLVLRQHLLASRSQFFPSEEARQEASRRISAGALELVIESGWRTVFLYLATADEVQTRELINDLIEYGVTVLVPRLVKPMLMRAVLFEGWDSLEPGQLGILTPRLEQEFPAPIDVALVPGLAFSKSGGRLGYGKGYYDRWLCARPTVRRVGLCFSRQLLPAIPMAEHDQVLDVLITEDGMFNTGARPV